MAMWPSGSILILERRAGDKNASVAGRAPSCCQNTLSSYPYLLINQRLATRPRVYWGRGTRVNPEERAGGDKRARAVEPNGVVVPTSESG